MVLVLEQAVKLIFNTYGTNKMNKIKLFLILFFAGCSNQNQETMKAPVAKKIPVTYSAHGDIRTDNYDWLRDDTRKKEEVLEHLKLENKYVDSWFNNQENNYEEEIMQEFLSRFLKMKHHFHLKTSVLNISLNHLRISNSAFTIKMKEELNR